VRAAYPDVRIEILATPGRRLSQELQDGTSFRYGIVTLGGSGRRDILAKLQEIKACLTFEFAPVPSAAAPRPAKAAAPRARGPFPLE
jgi:hypothetical protein